MKILLLLCGFGWTAIAIAWAFKGDWSQVLDVGAKAGLSFGLAAALFNRELIARRLDNESIAHSHWTATDPYGQVGATYRRAARIVRGTQ